MLRNLISRFSPTSRVSKSNKRDSKSIRSRRRSLRVESLENRITFDASLATVEVFSDHRVADYHLDRNGNTNKIGLYAGSVDFDPSVVRADDTLVNNDSLLNANVGEASRSYLAKYNPDSTFAWVRSLHGVAEAITADTNGNIFVGGRFFGNASIGNNTLSTSLTASDAFYAKYSSNGTFQWVRQDETVYSDGISDLTTDASGAVIGRRWTASGYASTDY